MEGDGKRVEIWKGVGKVIKGVDRRACIVVFSLWSEVISELLKIVSSLAKRTQSRIVVFIATDKKL